MIQSDTIPQTHSICRTLIIEMSETCEFIKTNIEHHLHDYVYREVISAPHSHNFSNLILFITTNGQQN